MTSDGTTLVDDLRRLAHEAADRPAIVTYRMGDETPGTLTYGELGQRVDRLAAGLVSLGVGPADIVSFQLPNWWEFAATYLAVARIGAVANPILPILRRREVEFILRRTGSRVCIAPATYRSFDHGSMLERLSKDVETLEHLLLVGGDGDRSFEAFLETPWERSHPASELDALRPSPSSTAEIMFTSGTTGEPKGVVHTYESMRAGIRCVPERLGLGPDDVVLMFSPLAHGTGFYYGVVMPVSYGIPVVYQDGWDPERMLAIAEEQRATWTMGTSAFALDACAAAEHTGVRLSSLRHFVCAGAPIPPVAVQRAADWLGTKLIAAWGMTEVGIGTMTHATDTPERLASSDGCPVDGVELRIADEDGGVLPAGTAGRLLIRTPGQHVGYLGRQDLYAAAFEDGWFDTGDVARMDADGYIRIAGRTKDLVIRGGENIPVVEVENVLQEHPAVREVAVVAVPDDRLGERACAVVVPEPGHDVTLAGLTSFLAGREMATQFWPEHLDVRAELPRTETGKVKKYELRAQLSSTPPTESR